MSVNAIIFDLDGTLLDTNRLGREAWKRACRDIGFEYTDKMYADIVGLPRTQSQRITENNLGPTFDYEKALALRHKYAEQLYRSELRLRPGVEQCLQGLKQRNIPAAVASSTYKKDVELLLDLSKLSEYFSHVIGGDQVAKGKPDPECYLTAAMLLGASSESCIIVEDTNVGVLGASRSGMRVVAIPDITPLTEESKQLAWKILESMDQLLDHL